MNKVTGEQVHAAMIEQAIIRVHIHSCTFCSYECGYIRRGDTLFYDSGCYCLGKDLHPRSWESAADLINMQTNNNIRCKFGLPATELQPNDGIGDSDATVNP